MAQRRLQIRRSSHLVGGALLQVRWRVAFDGRRLVGREIGARRAVFEPFRVRSLQNGGVWRLRVAERNPHREIFFQERGLNLRSAAYALIVFVYAEIVMQVTVGCISRHIKDSFRAGNRSLGCLPGA